MGDVGAGGGESELERGVRGWWGRCRWHGRGRGWVMGEGSEGLAPRVGAEAGEDIVVGGEVGVEIGLLGKDDTLAGADVEDVADGDRAGFAGGLAQGEEARGLEEGVDVGVEGTVVEGANDGEEGVGASRAEDADDLGGAGAADAGGAVNG